MSAVDTRNIARESLFLMAQVKVGDSGEPVRVKVRNLSAGGMMGEGDIVVERGARLTVNLRNIGEVRGNVAWVEANRFGVAFESEIDPKLARAQLNQNTGVSDTPRYVRPPINGGRYDPDRDRNLRKI